jgi:hypothetical protein
MDTALLGGAAAIVVVVGIVVTAVCSRRTLHYQKEALAELREIKARAGSGLA